MGANKIIKSIRQFFLSARFYISISFFILCVIVSSKFLPSSTISVATSIFLAFGIYLIFKPHRFTQKNNAGKKTPAPWIVTISTLLGLFAVRHVLENSQLVLKSFPQRTIGIVVLEGLDASLRSWLYILSIIIFVLIFSISYLLYKKTDSILSEYLGSKVAKKERGMLFSLSSISIFLFIFHYLNDAAIYTNLFDVAIFLILLIYSVFIAKAYFKKTNLRFHNILNNYDFVILSLLSPLVIIFIRWILIKGSYTFSYKYFLPYSLLWVLFWLILFAFTKIIKKNKSVKTHQAILAASIPLLLIPVSIPISNEIQFSFSGVSNLPIYPFIFLSVFFLIVLSIYIFIKNETKTNNVLNISFAKLYYLPILIASVVMFSQHNNFLDISKGIDMFHSGENLISTQQLFSFGSLPFIDLFPTHGLSYMVGQVSYSIINGYRAFEPWLWEWLIKIFEVLLFYFVLEKLAGSFFASIGILFLPIIGIFGGHRFIYGYSKSLATTYYLAPMAAALSLFSLIKNPRRSKLVIHWFICFFLVLWRVDFGITCIISSLIILFTLLLNNKVNKNQTSLRLKEVFFSLSLVGLTGLIVGAILSLLRGESLVALFFQNLEFIKFQAPAQSLINVAVSLSPIAIFQYLVLPSVGVLYIIFFIIRFLQGTAGSFKKNQWMLLFLAIFSLIMSVRSVQRQTLAVLGYNPYLFVFLGLSLPFYLGRVKKNAAVGLFLLMLLTYQFIFPNNTLLIKSGRIISPYTWREKESRININDFQYKGIVSFLRQNLDENQTFLDLTSSPAIYVAADKKFINYFIPNAYQTSDPIQKFAIKRIKKAYTENTIPIILFRQPNIAANNIDGVPNEIRSYRIYEFIYKNYTPRGYVDDFMIWTANGFHLPNPEVLIPITDFNQNFNLKKLPYIWGSFDEYGAKENTIVLNSFIENTQTVDPQVPLRFYFKQKIDKSSGNYIYLKINSHSSGTVSLRYGPNSLSSVVFDLIPSNIDVDYLIRISSQWDWINQEIGLIELSSSTNIDIKQMSIRKGD